LTARIIARLDPIVDHGSSPGDSHLLRSRRLRRPDRGGDGRLRGGGVVVLPTETVYGAAAVLGHDKGISRLKTIRGGQDDKPFTIHVARREQAMRYVGAVSEIGQRLMKKLWPGPVALVFDVPPPRRAEVAREMGIDEKAIYAADGTITLRCPDHIVATDVIGRIDEPVVVTVAGSAAQSSPTTIASELGDKVDLVLDAGPTPYNKPSTILHVRPDRYELVRPGVYDERIIERLLRTTILFVCSGNTCRSPMAESIARDHAGAQLNVPPDELEKKGISIISAGSFAMPGARATPQAVEAVKDLGADLTRHRSRPLRSS
jgi:protein-tyrosine phosphatase